MPSSAAVTAPETVIINPAGMKPAASPVGTWERSAIVAPIIIAALATPVTSTAPLMNSLSLSLSGYEYSFAITDQMPIVAIEARNIIMMARTFRISSAFLMNAGMVHTRMIATGMAMMRMIYLGFMVLRGWFSLVVISLCVLTTPSPHFLLSRWR